MAATAARGGAARPSRPSLSERLVVAERGPPGTRRAPSRRARGGAAMLASKRAHRVLVEVLRATPLLAEDVRPGLLVGGLRLVEPAHPAQRVAEGEAEPHSIFPLADAVLVEALARRLGAEAARGVRDVAGPLVAADGVGVETERGAPIPRAHVVAGGLARDVAAVVVEGEQGGVAVDHHGSPGPASQLASARWYCSRGRMRQRLVGDLPGDVVGEGVLPVGRERARLAGAHEVVGAEALELVAHAALRAAARVRIASIAPSQNTRPTTAARCSAARCSGDRRSSRAWTIP